MSLAKYPGVLVGLQTFPFSPSLRYQQTPFFDLPSSAAFTLSFLFSLPLSTLLLMTYRSQDVISLKSGFGRTDILTEKTRDGPALTERRAGSASSGGAAEGGQEGGRADECSPAVAASVLFCSRVALISSLLFWRLRSGLCPLIGSALFSVRPNYLFVVLRRFN